MSAYACAQPEFGARGDGVRANIARAEAELHNIKAVTIDQRIALPSADITARPVRAA